MNLASKIDHLKLQCEPMLPPIGGNKLRAAPRAELGSERASVSQPNKGSASARGTINSRDIVRRSSDPAVTISSTAQEQSHFLTVSDVEVRKPTGMARAKVWTVDVENNFRFQLAGFSNVNEYLQMFTCPEIWPQSGLIKSLQAKDTGYFMYFRPHRECEDKHLNRVKIYTFDRMK